MSFIKNLLVVAVVVVLLLLLCWQFGVEWYGMMEWVIIAVPFVVATLQLEDFWRKVLDRETRALVNWQYVVGMFWTALAIGAWVWGGESTTVHNDLMAIGATFLFGGAGFAWMATVYKWSVVPSEDREIKRELKAQEKLQGRWEKWRKKIKESEKSDAVEYLAAHLAFRTVGDTIDGDLDFSRPLGVVDGEPKTYKELEEWGATGEKLQAVHDYLTSLV